MAVSVVLLVAVATRLTTQPTTFPTNSVRVHLGLILRAHHPSWSAEEEEGKRTPITAAAVLTKTAAAAAAAATSTLTLMVAMGEAVVVVVGANIFSLNTSNRHPRAPPLPLLLLHSPPLHRHSHTV